MRLSCRFVREAWTKENLYNKILFMKKITITENKKCPICGKVENQIFKGFNRSGIRRCMCKECGKIYTINPKKREYSEDTRKLAIKMYCRGVGKVLSTSKANVYNWIKKTITTVDNSPKIWELDELYWFLNKKSKNKTKENIYLITMISREPRQIVGFEVAYDKSPKRIQSIVDSAFDAEKYYTDGYLGYVDIVYPSEHIRNIYDKSSTYAVEEINRPVSKPQFNLSLIQNYRHHKSKRNAYDVFAVY